MTADALIGPFRLVKSLGRGSTGEVFLAERVEAFPQRVAIKLLATAGDLIAGDEADHEADVLIALDHPYIVKLIDRGGLPDGRRFIVMEYIEGEPVDIYCAHHALGTSARIHVLMKVMDALSYSHRHLIIHTDLKPQNILVTQQGEPKLLDFGVAQHQAREGPAGYTPRFASPEQKTGARLTASSDVYSLGLIAEELLGELKDRDLEAIVRAATRSEPDERYASIDAFKADLQCFLEGLNISARAPSRLRGAVRWIKRNRTVAVAALAVVLTTAFAAGDVIRNAARADVQRALARNQLHELVALTGTFDGELYDSVGHLPQSGHARDVLLRGARATLAALAARDTRDSLLTVELARQYARLSRLQSESASESSDPAAAKQAAAVDLDQGLRLLDGVLRTDPEYEEAQHDRAAMRRSRAALSR